MVCSLQGIEVGNHKIQITLRLLSLTLPTGRKLDDIKESLERGLFNFEIYWKLSHVAIMLTAALMSLYCKREWHYAWIRV